MINKFLFWVVAFSMLVSLKTIESYENCFYLKLGSGASFSRKLQVTAPLALWDTAQQGYDSHIGIRPIGEMGIGYEPLKNFSGEVSLSFRPQYKYRKFQTPLPGTTAPGFLGTKTRAFDLDISSFMLTGYLNSQGTFLCWEPNICPGALYPIIGGGIGMSRLIISNFLSYHLPTVVPPSPSFGSSSDYTARYSFTYQLLVGLEYRSCSWAIGLGYRWFDIMKFKGPRFLRSPTGEAIDLSPHEMRLKFAAQELFVELKVYL